VELSSCFGLVPVDVVRASKGAKGARAANAEASKRYRARAKTAETRIKNLKYDNTTLKGALEIVKRQRDSYLDQLNELRAKVYPNYNLYGMDLNISGLTPDY
jgi:predicted RNase H-like nuclease (RuvC/YqgF family)